MTQLSYHAFLADLILFASQQGRCTSRPDGLVTAGWHLTTAQWHLSHPDGPAGPTLSHVPRPEPGATRQAMIYYGEDKQASDEERVALGLLKDWLCVRIGPTVHAALSHPSFGMSQVSVTNILDHCARVYGTLRDQDTLAFETQLRTYRPEDSLQANFARFANIHDILGTSLTDQHRRRYLTEAIHPHVQLSQHLQQYTYLHPDLTGQTYAGMVAYLISLNDTITPSAILYPRLSPVAAAVTPVAAAAIPDIVSIAAAIAALQVDVKKVQAGAPHARSSGGGSRSSGGAPGRVLSPGNHCNHCAHTGIFTLWSKCKTHNKHAK